MTRGMHYTPSHTKVSKFYNFQLTFPQLIFYLKCWNLAGLLNLRCSFYCWYSFLILTYLNFRPPFWRRVYSEMLVDDYIAWFDIILVFNEFASIWQHWVKIAKKSFHQIPQIMGLNMNWSEVFALSWSSRASHDRFLSALVRFTSSPSAMGRLPRSLHLTQLEIRTDTPENHAAGHDDLECAEPWVCTAPRSAVRRWLWTCDIPLTLKLDTL